MHLSHLLRSPGAVFSAHILLHGLLIIMGYMLGSCLASTEFALSAVFSTVYALSIIQIFYPKQVFLGAWLFYFGVLNGASLWLYYPLLDLVQLPWWLAIMLVQLLFVASAGLYASAWLFSAIISQHAQKNFIYFLALSIAIFEYCLIPQTFLYAPWIAMGFQLQYFPVLSALIPYFGLIGCSYVFWLICIQFAAILLNQQVNWPPLLLITLTALLCRYVTVDVVDGRQHDLRLHLAQENLSPTAKHSPEITWRSYAKHLQEMDADSADIIRILPEAVLNFYFTDADLIQQQLQDHPSFIGSNVWYDDRIETRIIGFGGAQGSSEKQHYVPFGEYIPGADILFALVPDILIPRSLRTILQYSSYHPPTQLNLLHYHGWSFYPFICYDLFFNPIAKLQKQADANVAIVENTWYRQGSISRRLLAAARFHALQSAKPMLLVMNSGPSVAIDGNGVIMSALGDHSKKLYQLHMQTKHFTFQDFSGVVMALWLCSYIPINYQKIISSAVGVLLCYCTRIYRYCSD